MLPSQHLEEGSLAGIGRAQDSPILRVGWRGFEGEGKTRKYGWVRKSVLLRRGGKAPVERPIFDTDNW